MAENVLTKDKGVLVYREGTIVLRKGNLVDGDDEEIIDEFGNNIYTYGVAEKDNA